MARGGVTQERLDHLTRIHAQRYAPRAEQNAAVYGIPGISGSINQGGDILYLTGIRPDGVAQYSSPASGYHATRKFDKNLYAGANQRMQTNMAQRASNLGAQLGLGGGGGAQPPRGNPNTNPFQLMADKAAALRTPEQQVQYDRAVEHAQAFPGNRYDSWQMLRNDQGWGSNWDDPRQDTSEPGYVPRQAFTPPPGYAAPGGGGGNPFAPPSGGGPGQPGAPPAGGPVVPPGGGMPGGQPPVQPPTGGPGGAPPTDPNFAVRQWFSGGQNPTNEAFYSQQFNRLVGQRDQAREREKQARQQWNIWQQAQAQKAAQAQPINLSKDIWDQLAARDVDPVQGTTKDGMYKFSRNPNITAGMSNAEVFNLLRSNLSDADQHTIGNLVAPQYEGQPNPFNTGKEWSTFSSRENLGNWLGKQGFTPERGEALTNLFNNIWQRSDLTTPVGGGPTAAPGYALPVPGMGG